jgi:CubicO group peptidase (beta-lactamase class C family)
MIRFLASILLTVSTSIAAAAPARTVPNAQDVAAYGERLLAEAVPDANGPGMAVLIARGDQILYRGARGRASIELGVALSPDQAFRIGSVTKQFAAAALLKLIDEGKAALDDPLSKYLPDFPNAKAITLHQLLNHTSGVRSYTDISGYMNEGVRIDRDTKSLIAVFKDEKPDFAPGEKWKYNNSGYVLVGAVIEAISGKPWHVYLDEAILQPLGLRHTRYGDDKAIIPGFVEGYSIGPKGEFARAGYLSMTQPHAAGALVSTLDDLWHWNLALHGGKVLGKQTYKRMTTPEGPAAKPLGNYGYGIQRGILRDERAFVHSGGINGFVSNLIYLPDSGLTAVSLRNADGPAPPPVDRRVLAFALGKPYPEPVPVAVAEAELKALEGIYRLDADTMRVLRVVDGALTSQRSGGPIFTLIPIGGDRFAFPNSLSRIEIERNRAGKVTGLRFYPDGDTVETWKLTDEKPQVRSAIPLPREAQDALVGEYVAAELAFKVFVDEGGILRAQVPGQPAFELKAESPRKLFIEEVGALIEFEPAEGQAQRATLNQGPAKIALTRKQP